MKENNNGVAIHEKCAFIVKTSNLSLQGKYMQYEPTSNTQKLLKKQLELLIRLGYTDVKTMYEKPITNADFRDRILNNSVGKEITARLTNNDCIAIFGNILKELVENENWEVSEAWYSLCDEPSNEKLWKFFIELHEREEFTRDIYSLLVILFGMPFVRKVVANPLTNPMNWRDANTELTSLANPYGSTAVGWLVLD